MIRLDFDPKLLAYKNFEHSKNKEKDPLVKQGSICNTFTLYL